MQTFKAALVMAIALVVWIGPGAAADGNRVALTISIDGAIGPASANYVKDGLAKAAERHAEVVILRLNTPGGLSTSMREIITDVLASPIPVIGYVAPSGAHAASAGTYILYATHLAAMAPGTNIGAATPVQIGGPLPGLPGSNPDKGGKDKDNSAEPKDAMTAKVTNDAVAFIRSLAELRGRNADWAEKAVRDAATLSTNAASQKAQIAAIAAGFAGLLSLFNIGGRFFWASLSDKIGRKNTYYTFFVLGIVLYALAPTFAAMGSKLLFVLGFGIILSMYGGGFATVPAYLADMFGTQFVGAIHGRLLTAWSTAGIIGPVVVNYLREFQLAAGVPRDQLYNTTMYILCAMLIAGFICNYMIKPVDPKWHMSDAEVAKLQAATATGGNGATGSFGIGKGGLDGRAALFWLFVGIPLAWGIYMTLLSAVKIL